MMIWFPRIQFHDFCCARPLVIQEQFSSLSVIPVAIVFSIMFFCSIGAWGCAFMGFGLNYFELPAGKLFGFDCYACNFSSIRSDRLHFSILNSIKVKWRFVINWSKLFTFCTSQMVRGRHKMFDFFRQVQLTPSGHFWVMFSASFCSSSASFIGPSYLCTARMFL